MVHCFRAIFFKWVSRTGGRLKWGGWCCGFWMFSECFACELPHAKHVRNLLWDQVLWLQSCQVHACHIIYSTFWSRTARRGSIGGGYGLPLEHQANWQKPSDSLWVSSWFLLLSYIKKISHWPLPAIPPLWNISNALWWWQEGLSRLVGYNLYERDAMQSQPLTYRISRYVFIYAALCSEQKTYQILKCGFGVV